MCQCHGETGHLSELLGLHIPCRSSELDDGGVVSSVCCDVVSAALDWRKALRESECAKLDGPSFGARSWGLGEPEAT